jgi:hypothetical protein
MKHGKKKTTAQIINTSELEISELARDRDFWFFAIDSVDCGGSTIIKKLGPGPLWVRELWGQKFI